MQRDNEFKLINGHFKPEDAKAILLELYNYKIAFHERERFSNIERYGKDLSNAERRIVELKTERRELEDLLNGAKKGAADLAIYCVVKIEQIKTASEIITI